MDGFVVIHRSIIETPIYQTPELFHLFVHCILRANYKERRVYIGGKVVDVKPGQFITGREKFAKEVGSPPSTVRYRLELLQRLEYVSIFSTASYSIITVNNYQLYQNSGNIGQPLDSRWTAFGQPLDTDNKETRETKKQEKYRVEEASPLVSGDPPTRPRVSYVSFLDTYNRIAGKTFGGRKTMTQTQKKKVKLLLEYLAEVGVTPEEYFERAIQKKFLKYGSSKRPWKADFDFLIKVDKADKLLNGTYDDFKFSQKPEEKKLLPEHEKNAIITKYEGILAEDRTRAEEFRESMINLKNYDPKLDKDVQ